MSRFIKFLSVFVLSFSVFTLAHAEKKEVPEVVEGTIKVTAEEVVDLVMDVPDLVIIDTRKPTDYAQGHIEGSINLPDTDTTSETLAAIVPTLDTPILLYCNGVTCGRSVTSAKIAIEAGYKKIYWFRGGMVEWNEKALPVEKG